MVLVGRPVVVFLLSYLFSGHFCNYLFLVISASSFHSNLWLHVSIFIWYKFVMNWVFSKFPKHKILHIWRVSNLHLWPDFKNFFNYAIWNFEMILKILFEKYFSKIPIFYLIFYVHLLCLKIAFFKRFFKKEY